MGTPGAGKTGFAEMLWMKDRLGVLGEAVQEEQV